MMSHENQKLTFSHLTCIIFFRTEQILFSLLSDIKQCGTLSLSALVCGAWVGVPFAVPCEHDLIASTWDLSFFESSWFVVSRHSFARSDDFFKLFTYAMGSVRYGTALAPPHISKWRHKIVSFEKSPRNPMQEQSCSTLSRVADRQ